MTTRILMLVVLTVLVPAIDLHAQASRANAAPAALHLADLDRNVTDGVIEIRMRGRGKRLYLPIAPSYRYYDYPYYARRGHYPKHIGPGFVYYGYPYSYYVRSPYRRYGGRCSYWHRKCARTNADRGEQHQGKAHRLGACGCP